MASMLENMQGLLTPAILSRVTIQTGESESAVMKGLGASVAAIAAMIANRSDDRGFMTQLADLAARTAAAPDAITSTNKTTESWLSSLFGNNLSGLAGSVARYAGIRGSTATSLLSIGAPLVLTYLGRWMRRDNLGAAELAKQLQGQRSQLAAVLPPGFDVPAAIRATAPVARYLAPKPETTSLSVPALIVLGIVGLGGLLWWGVRQYHEHAQTSIGGGMATLVGTSGTTSRMVTRALPGNVTLKFARGGIEDVLSVYLASPVRGLSSFEFDRIWFETGSATLTPESREQLRNVAAILNAYPKAHVTVSGHTDSLGDEVANRALSQARAQSVVTVLIDAGVAPGRMRADGLGSQKPIASNMTESGRSQNRRVMLDVMIK